MKKNLKHIDFINKKFKMDIEDVQVDEYYSHTEINEDCKSSDIAVIGLDSIFPKSNTPSEYWSNIRKGVCCTDIFPLTRRFDIDFLLHKNKNISTNDHKNNNGDTDNNEYKKEQYKIQGYLEEIDKFDPTFFNITPDEANKMSPVQRLFLEKAWGAIEDAGLGGDKLNGSNTGVFVGKAHLPDTNYTDLMEEKDLLSWLGSLSDMIASRISYYLNLRGPALVINTACSSSLVAVDRACKSILTGECEIAIAGGVNIMLAPFSKNKIDILDSRDSILRPFDKDSNGIVWGEGVGVVILKDLQKAIKERDNIYGIIKGSGINNDGTSNGITAPNLDSQRKLLLETWKKAGINPETFTYFEAHGAGTPLGDTIEIESITGSFKEFTNKSGICPIGTVKSNIGHLIGAAGIASLIKCLLIIKNREIPPTANFQEANPYIDFNNCPVYVSKEQSKIKNSSFPIRIGINSFGISGVNSHIVLEELAALEKNYQKEKSSDRFNIFTLSVKKEELLKDYIQKYIKYLTAEPDINLEDLCYTSNIGRGHYNYRLVIIVENKQELVKELIELNQKKNIKKLKNDNIYYGEHRVVLRVDDTCANKGKISRAKKEIYNKEVSTILKEYIESGKVRYTLLEEIVDYYIKGADINWSLLYDKENVRKISLPTYPFERRRCWVL